MAQVARWYEAHRLPPLVQVPLPVMSSLRDRLADRGWGARWGAVVLVGDIADVLARVERRPELPAVTVHAEPDAGWLGAYHYRGGELPGVAVDVLRAGASPRFLSVVEHDEVIAICRTSVSDGWVGLTAVEVAQRHRRRGLATHLLVGALELARAGGATCAYVQTEQTNAAALELYGRAGFVEHHHYAYHGPPPA
jgi:ribosomal protein S18 acetylase RimI-like enzyme